MAEAAKRTAAAKWAVAEVATMVDWQKLPSRLAAKMGGAASRQQQRGLPRSPTQVDSAAATRFLRARARVRDHVIAVPLGYHLATTPPFEVVHVVW